MGASSSESTRAVITRWGAAVAVLGLVLGAGISKLINVVLCRVQRRDVVSKYLITALFIKFTDIRFSHAPAAHSRDIGPPKAEPWARGLTRVPARPCDDRSDGHKICTNFPGKG